MSKPRERWWSYVKAMVRHYPKLKVSAKTVTEQRERDAVAQAIEDLSKRPDKLRLLSLVFFGKNVTLDGAAQACFISYDTARMWHRDFLYSVARHYGLMD